MTIKIENKKYIDTSGGLYSGLIFGYAPFNKIDEHILWNSDSSQIIYSIFGIKKGYLIIQTIQNGVPTTLPKFIKY
jgi:hypothetical protein